MKRLFLSALLVLGLLSWGVFASAQENQQPQDQQRREDLRKDENRPREDLRKDEGRPREDMRGEDLRKDERRPREDFRNGDRRMMKEGERMMKNGKDRGGTEQKDMMQRDDRRMEGREMMGDGEKREGMGSSEEEMAEQEKRMDEERFKHMKRGLKQFTSGIKRMKTELSRLEAKLAKCGAGVPEELKKAIAASEKAAPEIEAAQTAEQLDAVIGTVEENGELMREWGPKMGDLHRSCDMLRRAEQDLKKLKKDVARLEKRVNAQTKLDLSELLKNLRTELDKLASALQKAKDLAKTDPEGALEVLEDEFFEGTSDLFLTREALEMALNVTKGLRQADAELRRYDRLIKKLEKEKKDVTALRSLFDELKGAQKAITDLVKSKNFDPEDLVSLIEEAFDLRDELVDMLEDAGALQDYMPQFKGGPGVKFDLPPGFERQEERRGPPLEENNEREF